jgi:hypothetical protein
MGLFKRLFAAAADSTRTAPRQPSSAASAPRSPLPAAFRNMLPSDNVYSLTVMSANSEFQQNNWAVRVAGCMMQRPGELGVALVVPGEESGGLREALEQLPGSYVLMAVVEARLRSFGHELVPRYMTEAMWRDAGPLWAYQD